MLGLRLLHCYIHADEWGTDLTKRLTAISARDDILTVTRRA